MRRVVLSLNIAPDGSHSRWLVCRVVDEAYVVVEQVYIMERRERAERHCEDSEAGA